jgi:NAD(P)-dependent dehydrogenase (short-subunit alcohol dehydrogenase family)
MNRRDMRNQWALVTGAGSGIGRQTVFAFAEAGCRVIAVDRDEAECRRTVELAALLGPEAHAYTADVSDEGAMTALEARIHDAHGVMDIVVNNAGIGVAGPFLDTPGDAWRDVIGVNLLGVVTGCRVFGARMKARGMGGHLVNVASAAAFQPLRGMSAYCTSKAAVLMLSECLRTELAPLGIGVSAICPGVVATNITRSLRVVGTDEAAMRETATAWYARRGFGPEGVAEAIVRAVRDNADVVAVTPEAQVMHGMARFAPFALKALSALDLMPRERSDV